MVTQAEFDALAARLAELEADVRRLEKEREPKPVHVPIHDRPPFMFDAPRLPGVGLRLDGA